MFDGIDRDKKIDVIDLFDFLSFVEVISFGSLFLLNEEKMCILVLSFIYGKYNLCEILGM